MYRNAIVLRAPALQGESSNYKMVRIVSISERYGDGATQVVHVNPPGYPGLDVLVTET